MSTDTAQIFLESEDVATSRPSLSVVTPVKDRKPWMYVGLGLILAVGIFLRLPPMLFAGHGAPLRSLSSIHPNPRFDGIGYDENLYRGYVDDLIRYGLTSYPYFAERYLVVQTRLPGAILPPTRFVYVYSGYLSHLIFDTDSLTSLHIASSIFSTLLLLLGCLFAWRLGGAVMGISVAALMAFAPTQIHMSQHALIDGVFAFWATLSLWLLWENLQRPDQLRWLTAYGAALAVTVLTKENAMFAYIALMSLLVANYWLRFGVVTRSLLGFTVLGPLAGLVTLVFLCGGADTFYQVYRLLVGKASVLPYAIATGDGPWYRYLVDLMVMSPVILVLAIGGIFQLRTTGRAGLYLLIFVAASFLVMCNVRYGMNLRYTNMWDFPLRYLAVLCLWQLFALRRSRALWLALCVAAVCAIEFRQYHIFFVRNGLYELVTRDLLYALRILK